jgi:hypothetical protein
LSLACALALTWASPSSASTPRERDPDALRDDAVPSSSSTAPAPVLVDGHDLSALASLPADPRPARIIRGVHYWIGNEDRIDVFAPALRALRGHGGVHIGVGAEQNWVFAGWSRPDVVVMMDFDQSIVDLHHVYVAALALAPTARDFRALFVDVDAAALRAEIVRRMPAGSLRDGALEALTTARPRIARRIGRLVAHLPARGVTSFLTDDDDYAFVRGLVLAGRVFVVRGDLTGPFTMKAIAAACRTAGLPVASLYMSNAEQYFDYSQRTRENLSGLPWADGGIVLRTHGDESLDWADDTPPLAAMEADLEYLPANKPKDAFHYGVQSGRSLRAFLAAPQIDSALEILRLAPLTAVRGVSWLDDSNVDAVRRSWQKRRASASTRDLSTPHAATSPPSSSGEAIR